MSVPKSSPRAGFADILTVSQSPPPAVVRNCPACGRKIGAMPATDVVCPRTKRRGAR